MALQSGGGSKPVKKKAAPAPVELVSEHGQGGGTGGNDVGAIPTPSETTSGYPNPPADTGGGGSDNGGDSNSGGGEARGLPSVDWSSVLGEYGLPQDVIDELNRIFQQTQDINQAIVIGQAYVRGTPWYAQTYPGIQQGINAGLFGDEQGYRQYQAQVTQIYQQYYNRAPTTAELTSYITTGKTPTRVAEEFQSAAIKSNFSDPLKALFSNQELGALADEQAGIDTALGQKVNAEAGLYTQISPLYQNYFGRDVTRDELTQLTANGTDPQKVAQQFATAENINAMDPAIKDLFSSDEIHQIALDAAGGITQNGKQLANLANLATQLNPIYHQYTGQGVSRDEVNQALQNGTPVDTIAKQFAGAAFINANKGDIQQTTGAFGDNGQLPDDQLKAFGEETVGLDSPLGQQVTAAYQRAQQRLNRVFQGVLSHPALNITSTGQLAGTAAGVKPDLPA